MNSQRLNQIMRRQRKQLVQDVLFVVTVTAAVAASFVALNGM